MMRIIGVAGVVGVVGVVGIAMSPGCSGKQTPDAKGSTAPSARLEIPSGVPAEVAAVAVLQLPAAVSDLLSHGVLGPMTPERAAAMNDELSTYLRQQLGIDITTARSATAVMLGLDSGGVLMRPVAGALTGEPADDHAGVALHRSSSDGWTALDDGVLIAGDDAFVRASIDVLKGASPGLASDAALRKLIEDESAGASLAMAVDARKLAPLAALRSQFAVDLGVAAIGADGMRAAIWGEQQALEQIAAMAEQAMAVARAQIETEKATAKASGDAAEAVAAIVMSHHAAHAMEAAKPVVADGRLTVKLEGVSGASTTTIAVVGVLAAVAIPAFMKYIKKSKTTEARANLQTLYASVRNHYIETGKLPASAPLTPRDPTECCEKCAPDARQWTIDPWVALRFSVDEPHYYAYEYERNGSVFTVRAMGDLDCDGTYSTFEMYGQAGNPDVDIPDTAGVYRAQELE